MSNGKTQLLKCQICGKKFPVLATHIIRKHKITPATYLNRYPGSKLSTKEYRKKLSRTAKARFVKNPELRKKVASRTFDFIDNNKLKFLLQRDYKSAKSCLKNELWKPSIILYGSIIEAILREITKSRTFQEALEKSYKKELISEKEYHKIHMVRDLRNFVHLHKELSEGEEINEYWSKTFADICESIIKRFRSS